MSNKTKLAAIEARIIKLTAEADALAEKIANEEATTARVGDFIFFRYGRGEKVRDLSGVVVGSKSQEKGADLLKVQIGSGFDTEFVTIYPNQVVSVQGDVAEPIPSFADAN